MPDESFDAVIIGGGSKALYVAMYLVKYAGMSVGIFEDMMCQDAPSRCLNGIRGYRGNGDNR
jgi:thioredoxin reductase